MYFPFLRGKQFELIALRESAAAIADSKVIHPVIEPVRERLDSLARCLEALAHAHVPLSVIINPQKGELAGSHDAAEQILEVIARSPDPGSIHPAVFVTAASPMQAPTALLSQPGAPWGPADLIHLDYVEGLSFGEAIEADSHQFAASKDILRRYDDRPVGKLIKWTDPFPRKSRNLDYVGVEPTIFSDDPLYYNDDGYDGFADYATIGGDFSEGGGSPRAVAIHLTYLDDRRRIWIRHFTSTSNQDTADPAGKFGEAVGSLVAFADEIGLNNPAIEIFRRHDVLGTYPGLGVVKKLSIQNHLHVVMQALQP